MMYVIQAVVGGYLVIISILGISAARKVNIVWLIRYYWLSLIAIPMLFLFSVVVLDFKDVLQGWISHRWDRVEVSECRVVSVSGQRINLIKLHSSLHSSLTSFFSISLV